MSKSIRASSHRPTGRLVTLAVSTMLAAAPTHAETLDQALAAAYRYNPVIDTQRARLRATDEGVAIANAGFRPKVTASSDMSSEYTGSSASTGGGTGTNLVLTPNGTVSSGGSNRSAGYRVGVEQPIFTGWQLTSQVKVAEAAVRAGRELLRDTERTVFLQVVGAYADVIASIESLRLQERNLELLNREVKSTKERLAFNELTNTDVAQTEARRARTLAAIALARGSLNAARANYLQVVGNEPSNLSDPGIPFKGMPNSLADAISIATHSNPTVVNALYLEEAARHQVDQVRGQLLPQISLDASWGEKYNTQDTSYERSGVVGGRLTMPLYEGGQIHAQVRQAKEIHLSFIQGIEVARTQVRQSVMAAWARMEAARGQAGHIIEQIKQNQAALEGVRKEEGIGQRTYLDVLNAEQTLLDSQTELVTSRHNLLIASYAVLAQVGRLDAENLKLASVVYDPTVHYEEVRNKWFGLNITHEDGRREYLDAPRWRTEVITTK